MIELEPNKKITTLIVFIFILVVCFFIVLNALSIGDNLIKNAPNSEIFNPAKGMDETK
jgi:uncharacterized membrane protein YqiK